MILSEIAVAVAVALAIAVAADGDELCNCCDKRLDRGSL
jgi:hypothetical protein